MNAVLGRVAFMKRGQAVTRGFCTNPVIVALFVIGQYVEDRQSPAESTVLLVWNNPASIPAANYETSLLLLRTKRKVYPTDTGK
jgi:hypothetical protein